MSNEPQGFRDQLQSDLAERHGKVLAAIDRALEGTQKAWVNCPHCRKKSEVDVPDVRGALLASQFLADQSLGKPGTADPAGSDDERIIFVHAWGDSDADVLYEVAAEFVGEKRVEEFASVVAARQEALRRGEAVASPRRPESLVSDPGAS